MSLLLLHDLARDARNGSPAINDQHATAPPCLGVRSPSAKMLTAPGVTSLLPGDESADPPDHGPDHFNEGDPDGKNAPSSYGKWCRFG